jgi:glycosyltransferase involved in cell wall biosynthesis
MRVAFVTADWGRNPDGSLTPGGAGWVRIVQVAHHLKALGHETVVGATIAAGRDDRLVPLDQNNTVLMLAPDVIVIQRWMHGHAADAIMAARAAGQIVVNDLDDYFQGLDHRNMAHRSTDPARNPVQNRDHYLRALQASTLVTVSTPYLADRYARLGVRCEVIPNAIDLAMFPRQPVRDTDEGLTVGWCGALSWRSGDLETLRDVLPRWLADNDARFVHHGVMAHDTETAADRIGIPPHLVGPSKPIASVYDYPDNLAGFDIGIAPVAKIPFNRAKSAIKAMEYAAAGIPTVATKIDAYTAWGGALIANRPRDWLAHLNTLRDPTARQEVADAAYAMVVAQDFRVRIADWEAVYEALIAGPGTGDSRAMSGSLPVGNA